MKDKITMEYKEHVYVINSAATLQYCPKSIIKAESINAALLPVKQLASYFNGKNIKFTDLHGKKIQDDTRVVVEYIAEIEINKSTTDNLLKDLIPFAETFYKAVKTVIDSEKVMDDIRNVSNPKYKYNLGDRFNICGNNFEIIAMDAISNPYETIYRLRGLAYSKPETLTLAEATLDRYTRLS